MQYLNWEVEFVVDLDKVLVVLIDDEVVIFLDGWIFD